MRFNTKIVKERLYETFGNDSQATVGKKINTSQGNVSKMLSGTQQPTVETIFKIAQEYDVSADWLLGLTENKKISKPVMSYGDVLKAFTSLGDMGAIWPFPSNMISKDGTNKELPQVTNIEIPDEILQSILYEWRKMVQGPKDIYQMWLTKRVEEYSQVPYIPWTEEVRILFYEYRDPQGVSYQSLKRFYDAYEEIVSQDNEK